MEFYTRTQMQVRGWFGIEEQFEYIRENTFLGVAKACLKNRGISIPTGNPTQIFARALSGSDFPELLADSANKILEKAYKIQNPTYKEWMRPWPVKNFMENHIPRVGWPGTLFPVNPDGGEYKYLTLTDGGEDASLESYGGMLAFTRKVLINDDKTAFAQKAKAGGITAGRTISVKAYEALTSPGNLSDGVAFFHSSRGNLIEGTAELDVSLSADSLGMAVKALRTQKDESGNFIDFQPKILLVPPSQEITAWTLVNSSSLPGQTNSAVLNMFEKKYGIKVVVAPELEGYSSLDWYLFADQDANPNCFSLLTMSDTWPRPFVDQQMQWLNDNLETKLRVDFSAKAVNPKGVVKIVPHTE